MTDRTDYFTVREWRDYADVKAPRYGEQLVMDAQAEVIERLERWAHTAWPNVAVPLGAGAMTAADATLTLSTGVFDAETDTDVGRALVVPGAGVAGAELLTTIASVTDDTHAELAMTATTSVAGAPVRWGDGDGTALLPRSATEVFDGDQELLVLGNAPVIELDTFTWDSEAFEADAYYLFADRGHITFPRRLMLGNRFGLVTYSYGFTSCPRSVKRVCMQATMKLLQTYGGGGGKIPANVTEYTTENTTFVMVPSRPGDIEPWTWDPESSLSIQSYWGADRPGVFMAVI